MKPAPTNQNFHVMGYWAGGIFCVLSLLSLSLGLSPLITSLKRNLIMATCPGQQSLDLKLPGTYVGIGMSKGLPSETVRRFAELEYMLSDSEGRDVPTILKIPKQSFASDKQNDQMPLFQLEVPEKGKYTLISNYPYNMEGPSLQILLIHTGMNYVRMELIVGVLLFFVFGGLGGWLIWKSYRVEHPKVVRASDPEIA